jgi:RimJ/RimL family protein N-acetyltransferase
MKQIFESSRISFVELSELLITDYLIMINDNENVNRFISKKSKQITLEEEIAWVRKKLEEKKLIFSMIEKKTGDFIGNTELMDVGGTERELGIAITAKKQNKGYGTEAVGALLKYGFENLGLRKIVLRAKPDNARAIHVYSKCGFREYDRDGEHVYMEVLR